MTATLRGLWIVGLALSATAGAAGLVAETAVAPASVASAAGAAPRPAPAAPCAAHARASARPTSKLRHVPDEDDPCADSRGIGPRRPASAASR